MENASKALIMAGGILLTMLIISLIILARSRIANFYNQQDDLAEITDVAEFNLQFTNYENRNVYGYELVSLANKIADYNMRYSNAEGAKNDEKYNPITMKIYLNEKANEFNFGTIENGIRKINEKQNSFFYQYNSNANPMTQSSIKNDIINIIKTAGNIEINYGNSDTTTKLAKSINSLILSQEQINYNLNNKQMSEEQSKKLAVDTYKAITRTKDNMTYDTMVNKLTSSERKYFEIL